MTRYYEDTTLDDFAALDGFDSRDTEDRIALLEAHADALAEHEGPDGPDPDMDDEDAEEYRAHAEELDLWRELIAEVEGYSGDRWRDGIYLIADDAFEDHARQLAEDIGAIDSDAGWPTGYIDWPRAADALKMDYTSIEIRGHDFWYR